MNISSKQNNLQYIQKKLAKLQPYFSGFDIFSISSWSEITLWQAANGMSKRLPCLFQAFLVASLFRTSIRDMMLDAMSNTDLLDEELKDPVMQKFICFTLRNNILYNLQALYNFWIDAIIQFKSNSQLSYYDDDNTVVLLRFVFKTMDIIERKFPLSYLKVFLENPTAYYSDKEFYAYVHTRLKSIAKKHPNTAVLQLLNAFEMKAAYLANTAAFMN